jgi:hypothetical protein
MEAATGYAVGGQNCPVRVTSAAGAGGAACERALAASALSFSPRSARDPAIVVGGTPHHRCRRSLSWGGGHSKVTPRLLTTRTWNPFIGCFRISMCIVGADVCGRAIGAAQVGDSHCYRP